MIVSFQEGDPDQPIITGRVYNVLQIPPGNLPASKTQMHIQSKTYKGKGYNSIMFDDATHNELFYMQAERDMETLVKHDQRNLVKNNRTFDVKGTQTTTIGKGRSTTIYTGNDIKNVLSGNLIETISLLRSTQARDIFKYATNRIELEVGEQTSLTMDNEKILLRFGKNTILMNQEGIWLDGVHIGLQEKNPMHQNNESCASEKKFSNKLDVYDIFGPSDGKSMPYTTLNLYDQTITTGYLDEMGRTERFYSDSEDKLRIFVGNAKVKIKGE